MKKRFEIEFSSNKNVAEGKSTVVFVATPDTGEAYRGTVVVDSTDDRLIGEWLGSYLPEHIRAQRVNHV